MKRVIQTEQAPGAIGPYSQAIRTDSLIITSGQLPINPSTGVMPVGIEAQTRQSLNNCKAILEAANMTMHDVIKTTVYLNDMDNFDAMCDYNESILDQLGHWKFQ